MPSNAIATDVIQFNRENGTGKHYTNAEIEKRQEAEAKLKRKTVRLTAPDYLKSEHKAAAFKIWKRITGEAKDIELFDNCDSGTLAAYCDVRAQYEEATSRMLPDLKKCEKLLKLMLMYAEKLGLTPVSRARLVVKRAGAEEPDDKGELFE
ncbi:P27 family phage terminase small subunit [Phascolarctobacterium faecium]|uniref:P27 family phage terminase small subunit n=1 Tax=Phascolarctobacterium faecium TaxID=33025 RepID=UPI0015A8B240|nr:P27 family phage terminase small subunit [uncultured Phascolarctobacterium sp.]